MEYDNLFSPIPSSTSVTPNAVINTLSTAPSISNHSVIMGYLNKCEGFKTKIKELHWASQRFPASRGTIHSLLDDLLDIVSDYQDVIAEVSQSFLGVIQFNTLKAIPCECVCPLVLVKTIEEEALNLKRNYNNDVKWSGIINATDQYIQDLQQKTYLLQLCMGSQNC